MISSLFSIGTGFFSFCLVITLIVSVHEMGHYIVARLCGVHVESFSLGFGPEILGHTSKKGTRWKISLFLVGGYVKMREKKENGTESFYEKSVFQKIAIALAGPFANFLLAILIFASFFKIYGIYQTPPVIGKIIDNSVAESIGLMQGDTIEKIDGEIIASFEEMRNKVASSFDKELVLEYETVLKEKKTIKVTPARVEKEDEAGNVVYFGQLGIIPAEGKHIPLSFRGSLVCAIEKTFFLSKEMVSSIKQIIEGTRNREELGGPLRIAHYSHKSLERGIIDFLWFNALLSINLGIMNLIPLPLLDGGHVILHMIEAIRRKALSEKVIMRWTQIGVALVLFLMIDVTWNDLNFFLREIT